MKREITSVEFGDWVKEKRRKAGMRQDVLAGMIPVNKNTLSRYVTGEKTPPLDVVEKICEIFGAELVIRENAYDEGRTFRSGNEGDT